MPKLMKWPKKITFTRTLEGGTKESEKDVEVEVPQLDAALPINEFTTEAVGYIGDEQKYKDWVNTQIGNGAIGSGRSGFAASGAKKETVSLADAVKDALQAIKDYVPGTARGLGTGVTSKAKKFDELKEAFEKMKSGEITSEQYEELLVNAMS